MAGEDMFDKLNDEDARVEALNGQIQQLANELGFTYHEAFEYVITVGLAYARGTRETTEPGE